MKHHKPPTKDEMLASVVACLHTIAKANELGVKWELAHGPLYMAFMAGRDEMVIELCTRLSSELLERVTIAEQKQRASRKA